MFGKTKFKKLLEPGHIGPVLLKNRIIKTGAGTGLLEDDGRVSETMKHYCETMAKGGCGLLIYEYCSVEFPRGMLRATRTAHFSNDKLVPGYTELVKVVHKHDCPFFMQLMHSGPWYQESMGFKDRGDRVAASAFKKDELPDGLFTPVRELKIKDIEGLIDTFAKAALRAKKAGFDGVEINASHYHLINTFLSGFWNRRHDEYGCDSLENRARFMCNIIREVKKQCGNDYPVSALFNAAEYGIKNGTRLEEAKTFARLFEKAGADVLHIRAGGYGAFSGILHIDRFYYPELPKEVKAIKDLNWNHTRKGITVPLGAAIKKEVSIPVFLANRLDPKLGEKVLRQGKLDFIGMTRRLFADPEIPKKVAEGRLEDIAPCSGCNYCWHLRARMDSPLRCRINAALGRGKEFDIKPAKKKKKVLIVGGGPSGLEAARVAALRGHEVIIYEKETKLGGLSRLAALVKDLELGFIMNIIRYLKIQNEKLGVKIELSKEVDASVIDKIKPDVLILATGGLPTVADIPGIDNHKVANNAKLHGMLKFYMKFFPPKILATLTKLWMPIGKRVVIIGGDFEGCQLGEFLIKRGRKVTIVDTAEELGKKLISDDGDRLFKWMEKKGAILMPKIKYDRITNDGLVITTMNGVKKIIKADTIIPSTPLKPDDEILKRLKAKVHEVYQIGDCREPGYMSDAIADGARIGRMI
jgi:2,4-dienoyl-CoA reductase (NADPH2)